MRGQKLSKIHFLILLSLLGFISPLQSQEYKFRTLGVEDGLSQITVSDICQDEKSRIWIATLDGLNCFDGNHIKVFNHFHNDSISYGIAHARYNPPSPRWSRHLPIPYHVPAPL